LRRYRSQFEVSAHFGQHLGFVENAEAYRLARPLEIDRKTREV
jgi:hypothetical protein